MALRYLLDSDVLLWHLRGHEATRELIEDVLVERPLGCSSVSIFEVWTGVRPKEEATRRFLDALETVWVGDEIAYRAADYWRALRRKGITVGRADTLIVASAQVGNLVLVTYNPAHYPMKDIELYEPMPELR